MRLVLEEHVVHFPELPLLGRRLRRLRRMLGVRVDLGQRKIAEHEAEAFAQAPLHLADDGMSAPAMWAFVVTVFDEGDRSVVGARAVVGIGDRRPEATHRASVRAPIASSASKIPSAPGFTPIGETNDQRMMPSASITKSARSHSPTPVRYTPYRRATSPLGSKSASSGKCSSRSAAKAAWHQTPSTEIPRS